MLKKIISLLVLVMYMHGMSGYTMSFHKCTITGFENIYTSFGLEDPCDEAEKDCQETSAHFEQADCCDILQTVMSVDDNSNISYYKNPVSPSSSTITLVQSYLTINSNSVHLYSESPTLREPQLCSICVFRI